MELLTASELAEILKISRTRVVLHRGIGIPASQVNRLGHLAPQRSIGLDGGYAR